MCILVVYTLLKVFSHYSQSASPIQHTANLVFGYKVFLKVYFNVKYMLISNPSAARPKTLSVLQNSCFKLVEI